MVKTFKNLLLQNRRADIHETLYVASGTPVHHSWVDNKLFSDIVTKGTDKIATQFDNILILGDLNYDCMDKSKGSTLFDLCDIFDFRNLIKSPTCFTKNFTPSLVDVILTNKPQYCFNTLNFGCGVSDCHNFIGTVVKGSAPRIENSKKSYRSFKNFEPEVFNEDISRVPFHAAFVFDDVDDIYWAHEVLLNDVIKEHAPVKERKSKIQKPPYMNGELRRSIFKKHMLFNKYKKFKTSSNWEIYRKQRNAVTKLKKQSMRCYFYERCAGGPKSKDFWPTIKPFLSKKGQGGGTSVVLSEGGKVVTDQTEVCSIFNNFFMNVAKDIGTGGTQYEDNFSDHPSIKNIKENLPENLPQFSFRPVNPLEVSKIISNLNIKKATGVDNISAKILKSCAPSISHTVSSLINKTFETSNFPHSLKVGQVLPLHKKKDPLNKENYRPVSILNTTFKIYERAMHDQLAEYFEAVFNPFLAAFRKGFGCQTTLLRLLEDWKRALDNHECVAAILMDLSKAFDCLPHGLLRAKLIAYGLSAGAVDLLDSYLSNRQQRVNLGPATSNWESLFKGVPQGSILGPLIFNIFINDIFYIIKKGTLYNYADDNTLSFIHKNLNILKEILQGESILLIQWFTENLMKANPDKFQAICIGQKTHDAISSFQLNDTVIHCEDNVTLLGVNIDFMLNFNDHISDICKKASQQLAVLKRIGRFLTKHGKLTIFKSFIMSNLNYCPLTWHFCNQASINKMEKIQERALRFISNDFSSTLETLLVLNKATPLHIGRMKLMASEVFKILHNLSPTYIQDLVKEKVSLYDFRNKKQVEIPRVNSKRYGMKSFRFGAAQVWNSLPNEVRLAENYKQFRRLLQAWDGVDCKCTSCSC